MTDVVLSSMLNTNSKSMNFVCSVLNLNAENDSSDSEESSGDHITDMTSLSAEVSDYFNENFVESRARVEVSKTCIQFLSIVSLQKYLCHYKILV